MTLSAGTRLGPYEILAPLGAGGMGEVYRARDSKLERDVAVKVLPASVADDAEALSRFEREAKAVAALSHPNILAIFDFGRHEEIVYAVTELLEGVTLRGKLDAGPVSQRQAVDYGLQIARGLSAAHERGIVHRDLKPENVFLTRDGHVKILDFGLAKRVEAAPGGQATEAPTVEGQTEPGKVMGTVGYMSPEQVKGLPVDHRSDLFSFGAILYELLSGSRAFRRDTSAETIVAILTQEPPELVGTGRNISPALDHIVRHCLEKDRENRFQTAKDVAFALSEASGATAVTSGAQAVVSAPRRSGVWIALAVLAVLAAAGVLLLRLPQRGATSAGLKRVAVLPFENLGASEDDYFADGIADQIRGKLTALPGIEVIARGSSTPYKKTNKTPQEIARELSASYLLTATVRWQKGAGTNRVQVNPELVEIKSDGPPASKWQQPFDAALTDVFQVQSDIASKVAESLGLALAEGQKQQLSEKPTQNLAAYDAFLKGEEASAAMGRNDPTSLRRALTSYEQAVALDPQFALAWARLSQASSLLYANSVPTLALAERARSVAEKTIALAPNRPEGYEALGNYYRLIARDSARAREEYAKGLKLAPGNPDLLRAIGRSEEGSNRWDEALEHVRQAQRLDPRSVANTMGVGEVLLRLRKPADARLAYERARALSPQNLSAIEGMVLTHLSQGDLEGARAFLARAGKDVEATALVAYVANYWDLVWVLDVGQMELLRRLTPAAFDENVASWAIVQAQASHLAGDRSGARVYAEQAREAFETQLPSAPNDATIHALRGLALAYLGRNADAVREGERAVALDSPEKDGYLGPYYLHQLVRIETAAGEHERAIDHLEALLKMPYFVSRDWLKIDPNFDPLRTNPRFQKLVAKAK